MSLDRHGTIGVLDFESGGVVNVMADDSGQCVVSQLNCEARLAVVPCRAASSRHHLNFNDDNCATSAAHYVGP